VSLEALLREDSRNGYSRKPDDDPAGVPTLRISAATSRHDRVVDENDYKRIGAVSAEERKTYGLEPGDLLACRFNGNKQFVGRLAEYSGSSGLASIYPDKLIRLRLDTAKAHPTLVRYFAASDLGRAEIEAHCATTVGNWGISATNLKRVVLPIPPRTIQGKIVETIEALLAICDRLSVAMSSRSTYAERSLDVLLRDAMRDRDSSISPP
jgi:type I restriction enzyme S subunit